MIHPSEAIVLRPNQSVPRNAPSGALSPSLAPPQVIQPTLEMLLIRMPTGLPGYNEVMGIMRNTPSPSHGLKSPECLSTFKKGENLFSALPV